MQYDQNPGLELLAVCTVPQCCIVSLEIRQRLHLLLLVTPISLRITFVSVILCIILI